jgi:hypothetical protein
VSKYAKRVDANHAQVKSALTAAGCVVEDLSAIGGGVPDLLVGYMKRGERLFWAVEVKDGQKVKSAQKLTDAQIRWHEKFAGWPVSVVDSAEAALRHLKVLQA